MRKALAAGLLILILGAAGCAGTPGRLVAGSLASQSGEAAPSQASSAPGSEGAPAPDPALNPHVPPPAGGVRVSPDLPPVKTPPGMISQQEAIQKAVASQAQWGAVLILTEMKFDERNGGWEIHFQTDGRLALAPRSHPAEFVSQDPIEQRKHARSWLSVASEVTLLLDGQTGEVSGFGFVSRRPDPNRPDLEHYRGRIVVGGETTVLRLVNPDGSFEGRTLTVDVPQDALAGDLALWHLEYGIGRVVDVWGLTGPGGRVVAYRVAMPERPDEKLLRFRLVRGVPAHPAAVDRPGEGQRQVLFVPQVPAAEVVRWYQQHMPEYGWESLAAEGEANRLRFRNAAGAVVEVWVAQVADGTEVTLTWPGGQPGA